VLHPAIAVFRLLSTVLMAPELASGELTKNQRITDSLVDSKDVRIVRSNACSRLPTKRCTEFELEPNDRFLPASPGDRGSLVGRERQIARQET